MKRRQRDVGRAREAEAGRQRKCRALKRAAGGPAPAPLEVEPLTEAVLSTLEEFLVAKLGQLPSRALMQRAAESLAERAERPER